MYRPRVLSRHPSHRILRTKLPRQERRSLIRLGSTTPENDPRVIQINSVQSVQISADKRLMKQKFTEAGVRTAPWVVGNEIEDVIKKIIQQGIKYPIVAKSFNGSRGVGNTKIDSERDLRYWANHKEISRYVFEKYMNYALEFRLHITKDGCFYACRKAVKRGITGWQRHSDSCVWYLETNEKFFKPNTWDSIVADCVRALKTIGADILSFDIRVQSDKDKEGNDRSQNWILIESNSASSMNNDNGISVCAQKYIDIIPKLIRDKIEGK